MGPSSKTGDPACGFLASHDLGQKNPQVNGVKPGDFMEKYVGSIVR